MASAMSDEASTPLYWAAMQKARIAYARLCDADKQRILYDSAAELLGL